MGLNERAQGAPAATGVLDPRTGKPVGESDPFFRGVTDELADKGFLVTATDELITWAREHELPIPFVVMVRERDSQLDELARTFGGVELAA